MRSDLKAKIETRIAKSDTGCWLWTGYVGIRGYGQITHAKKTWKAHRLSYQAFKGPIPDGTEIDHLCRVRCCVNPDHLEAVPKRVNILRGVSFAAENAQKNVCPKGHAYDDQNTYRKPNGYRICRVCRKERYNAMYERRREEILARQRERYHRIAALEEKP